MEQISLLIIPVHRFVRRLQLIPQQNLARLYFLGISHQGLELSEKEVDKILRRELSIKGSWNSFGKPFPGSDWTGAVDFI